jgi:hypothetical protein
MGMGEERGVDWSTFLETLTGGFLFIKIRALLAKLDRKKVEHTCNLGKFYCPLLYIHKTHGQNWCTPWKHSGWLCLGAALSHKSTFLFHFRQ